MQFSLAFANHILQSASYASTAGVLQPAAGSNYTSSRPSDAGIEQQQRAAASPRSTPSSGTSHAVHAYAPAAMPNTTYPPAHAHAHAGALGPASSGLGIGPSADPPDLRLAVPVSAAGQTTSTSWHQPSASYSSDLSSAATLRTPSTGTWDYTGANYLPSSTISPATGLPSSAQAYNYQSMRFPSLTSQAPMPNEHTRFVPLQGYQEQSQPSTTS